MQTEQEIISALKRSSYYFLRENRRNQFERHCRIGKITRKPADLRRLGWFGSSEGIETFYRYADGKAPTAFQAVAGAR